MTHHAPNLKAERISGGVATDPRHDSAHKHVTGQAVKAHFGSLVLGDVQRFELPNLRALNFLLHNALDGGGTMSLMTDAQGKTFSTAMLRMEIDVDDALAKRALARTEGSR